MPKDSESWSCHNMSYINSYKPPPPPTPLAEAELYGTEPYDPNWVFPIMLESLESERVKLVPFVPSVHAKHYWTEATKDPDLWRYYSILWRTFEEYLTWVERQVRRNPSNILFAILDKTRPDVEHPEFEGGSLAGVLGLFYTSDANLLTEIAFVAILPAFQRTHVASNAAGILMRYCLELPSASPPGLGLRRVQWCAHSRNVKSAKLAERMGFKREGVLRWMYVMPEELRRDGDEVTGEGRSADKPGRHTLVLSVCWDDWENGVREIVQRNIDRRV